MLSMCELNFNEESISIPRSLTSSVDSSIWSSIVWPTRTLTTANRSRISTHVALFARGRGMVDPVKFSSHLVWSPYKIWLLFLIPCAPAPRYFWDLLHTVCVHVGGPKNIGVLGPPHRMGTCLTPRNTPLSTCVTIQIWSFHVKHYKRTYGDPPGKWPLTSRLSRPLKVIGTDTDRSVSLPISDLWAEINGDFGRKLHNFPNPGIFNGVQVAPFRIL